jgi:ATP-binding cassette subfamily B protein
VSSRRLETRGDDPLGLTSEPRLTARLARIQIDELRRSSVSRWTSASGVRSAGRIYVMDGGRVPEHETHERLLAAAGTYAQHLRLQARAYQVAASPG